MYAGDGVVGCSSSVGDGFSEADALRAAFARYYNELFAQTQLLAFMDCFHILGVVTLIGAPLALLTKGFKLGGKSTAAH